MKKLKIKDLRDRLIRQEETIIFALIERAQFKQNSVIYEVGGLSIGSQNTSFFDYLLRETEIIHARARRYTSPDEHPFFEDLPDPILPPLHYESGIKPSLININFKIKEIYIHSLLSLICGPGDDGDYGSSATCDVTCVQALSKRIHYGKFVAEAKFQEKPEIFSQMIEQNDASAILKELTHLEVEEKLYRRVRQKATTYGRDIEEISGSENYKINPDTIASIYRNWIIPLTKEVEVEYLLQREVG